jgi:hypothetical protein
MRDNVLLYDSKNITRAGYFRFELLQQQPLFVVGVRRLLKLR